MRYSFAFIACVSCFCFINKLLINIEELFQDFPLLGSIKESCQSLLQQVVPFIWPIYIYYNNMLFSCIFILMHAANFLYFI